MKMGIDIFLCEIDATVVFQNFRRFIMTVKCFFFIYRTNCSLLKYFSFLSIVGEALPHANIPYEICGCIRAKYKALRLLQGKICFNCLME